MLDRNAIINATNPLQAVLDAILRAKHAERDEREAERAAERAYDLAAERKAEDRDRAERAERDAALFDAIEAGDLDGDGEPVPYDTYRNAA